MDSVLNQVTHNFFVLQRILYTNKEIQVHWQEDSGTLTRRFRYTNKETWVHWQEDSGTLTRRFRYI